MSTEDAYEWKVYNILKHVVVAESEVLSRHIPGETEEKRP